MVDGLGLWTGCTPMDRLNAGLTRARVYSPVYAFNLSTRLEPVHSRLYRSSNLSTTCPQPVHYPPGNRVRPSPVPTQVAAKSTTSAPADAWTGSFRPEADASAVRAAGPGQRRIARKAHPPINHPGRPERQGVSVGYF